MQRSVFVAMVAFLTPYDIIKLYLFFPKIVKSYIPLKRGNFVHNLLSKTVKEKYSVLKVFFLVLLFFGANVFLSFSTDSYSTLSAGFHTAAQDMLERNGRPIIALIYKLHSLSGLPGISFYYISSGLALLFLGIAVWLYQKLLARYSLPENIRILLAFASIANIYIIEYFMFIEKCGFMLAILFNVIAVQSICGFFERKNTHPCNVSLLCAVLAMTLAVFTYQGTVALFVVLSIPFAFYHAKNFREYVCNIISIGVCYAVPVLLAFAAFKWVFNGTRLQTDFNLLANLKEFFGGLWMCNMETFDIFPHYIFYWLFCLFWRRRSFLHAIPINPPSSKSCTSLFFLQPPVSSPPRPSCRDPAGGHHGLFTLWQASQGYWPSIPLSIIPSSLIAQLPSA